MAVRVLLVLAAFAILYGCDQANSPAERQEQRDGVEKVCTEWDTTTTGKPAPEWNCPGS